MTTIFYSLIRGSLALMAGIPLLYLLIGLNIILINAIQFAFFIIFYWIIDKIHDAIYPTFVGSDGKIHHRH
jgi:hypothetical protein